MRCPLLRLAVALVTFGIGVTATTLWIAYRTPDVSGLEEQPMPGQITLVAPQVRDDSDIPPPPPPTPMLSPAATNSCDKFWAGVLDNKALEKPAPSFPAMGKSVRASGTVVVQVCVNGEGRVIGPKAVSGHPLLQSGAVQAAYRARFTPAPHGDPRIKVSGVLTYKFTL